MGLRWVVLSQQRSFVSQDECNFVQIGLSKKKYVQNEVLSKLINL